jgi:hypothetical protein
LKFELGDLGLVGGEVKGDIRMPLFGVRTGEDGSHIPPGKDAVFCKSSGVVAATGKHDVQVIGDI